MSQCRFNERIARLNISYRPEDAEALTGPIRVSLPGYVVYMTAEQAEIAAGLFAGVAAIARRHAEDRLLCPPDCPNCGHAMNALFYSWVCPECRTRRRMVRL